MLLKILKNRPSNPEISSIEIIQNARQIKGKTEEQLNQHERTSILNQLNNEHKTLILINRLYKVLGFFHPDEKKNSPNLTLEECRRAGEKSVCLLNDLKLKEVIVISESKSGSNALAFIEGMLLGNYQFIKYKSEKKAKSHSLHTIYINCAGISQKDIDQLNIVADSVFFCRNLVNEPQSWLTAVKLSEEISGMAKSSGVKVEVFNKSRIEALKMNGLLTVNKGSSRPPTFTVMEWKPSNAVNKKPIVLIGKGVVFDTGGINLKSSAGLDGMKCDMSGAAAVSGAICAIARLKLPLYIIGLLPATDNRPSGNAYVPGDIIAMMNGATVEVLNTDAEGRLILADAICYADLFKPSLLITMATLTGAAHAAIGKYGIVAMGADSSKAVAELKKCGDAVHERLAEFPFWNDYDELIKSDVADIKNVGGPYGGAITAGKFLAYFTKHPFIHLDIAGPAFVDKKDSYRGQGGTGVGVRLLVEFARVMAAKKS
ncbi:MAG: leucyl aminopeptidase [Bacteroidota bacterium]